MKRFVLSLTLLLLIVKSFSQTPAFSTDYLKKSKSQKTIGWVVLGGGVVMGTIGYITFNKKFEHDPFGTYTSVDVESEEILLVGGFVFTLGSIPFFISSAKNARKAAAISFNYQQITLPNKNTLVLRPQPAVFLKIIL